MQLQFLQSNTGLHHRFRKIDFSNKRKISDGPKEAPNDQRKIKQHAQPIGPIGSVANLGYKPTNECQMLEVLPGNISSN